MRVKPTTCNIPSIHIHICSCTCTFIVLSCLRNSLTNRVFSYLSGRQAVCLSRRVEGGRGFYTLVYDDVEGSPLLAYFTPTGKACCYHPNGSIHMICDREGGSMYNEVM